MQAKLSQSDLKIIRSLRMKKSRDELGLFVAEGEKCISELAKSFELVYHLTTDNTTAKDLERISNLQTPQGQIAVFRRPDYAGLWSPEMLQTGTLLLALDEVQDPGNVGTIIRTADWFGIRHILCTTGTADCFSPKVVQATMGALARVQLHYMEPTVFINTLRLATKNGLPVYGTLLDGRNIYHRDAITNREAGIIIMGNEGNGLSQQVRHCVTHPLFIPSFPPDVPTSESLNVAIATAIVLAEFRRAL